MRYGVLSMSVSFIWNNHDIIAGFSIRDAAAIFHGGEQIVDPMLFVHPVDMVDQFLHVLGRYPLLRGIAHIT